MTLLSRQVMSDETADEVIIVVSSRLPYELIKATTDNGQTEQRTGKTSRLKKSVSGLVTAISEGFKGLANRASWMGGIVEEDVDKFRRLLELQKLEEPASIQQDLIAVAIDREKYDLHRKWSNGQLWPILHEMPEKVDTTAGKDCWESYKNVNQMYATAIVEQLRKLRDTNTIVWIHDYHLFLVPKLVSKMASQQNLRCRIGFFLHTTFPTVEKLEKLPNFKEILDGVLGSNSIGFQTQDNDCRNFINCCKKHMNCVYNSHQLQFQERKIFVQAVPVGIVYPESQRPKEQLSEKLPKDLLHKLQTEPGKTILLIGVDRLDYTKGLVQKVKTFASPSLQTKLKELHNLSQLKFIYLQIAIPCRKEEPEYKKLREEFDKRVEETKQLLKEDGHPSEMHVSFETFSPEELSVLYGRADVALVTPLIDGLNLVALEYIAWRDEKPGVLVLSIHAGAAKYLSDDALKVDPRNTKEMENAIYEAICMTLEERKEKMGRLQEQVKRKLDAKTWVQSNLEPLKDHTENKAKL